MASQSWRRRSRRDSRSTNPGGCFRIFAIIWKWWILFTRSRKGSAARTQSIQDVLERTMLRSIARLLQRTNARHLGLAGGVFANVKLNRLIAEKLPIDEIFIFPAMGDDGMSAGGALCYLLQRDGLKHWLSQRRRLHDVCFARDYTTAIDKKMEETAEILRTAESPAEGAARRLNAGQL